MKIAVLGATGRSGQVFIRRALAEGHTIRAGARSPDKVPVQPGLEAIKCDATIPEEVRNLLKDQDAVVSLVGHVKGSSDNMQTVTIQNVIKAMQERVMTRVVSLTGTGVRFPGDKITLLDRLLDIGIRLFDPPRVKDGIEHVRKLENSDLEWTVIRVLKLQNTKPKSYSLRQNGPTKLYVGREDAARAILEVLKDHTFIRQAPIIGKP